MTGKKAKSQRGQGIVELIMTIFAFFTVFFMFVQLALGFAVSNYYQYVTFIAARAFLAGHNNDTDRKEAAQAYVDKMLRPGGKERFEAMGKGTGDGDPPGVFIGKTSNAVLGKQESRKTAWEQGVTYRFKIKMYMMPLISGAQRGKGNQVELQSQSWLGADPTSDDCKKVLSGRKQISGIKGDILFDNGC